MPIWMCPLYRKREIPSWLSPTSSLLSVMVWSQLKSSTTGTTALPSERRLSRSEQQANSATTQVDKVQWTADRGIRCILIKMMVLVKLSSVPWSLVKSIYCEHITAYRQVQILYNAHIDVFQVPWSGPKRQYGEGSFYNYITFPPFLW